MMVATASRRKFAIATIIRDSGSVPRRSGARMLIFEDGTTQGTIGGGAFELNVIREALAALATGQCATREYSFNPVGTSPDAIGAVCGGRVEVFLEAVMPTDRLLIVGGGHCGRALAQAASLLGFAIVVADDRAEFARREDFSFPGVEQIVHIAYDFHDLPEPDAQTYVVLVTRGFETDQAALRQVVNSSAAYIGMIGSQKKRHQVFANLREQGVSANALARVHVPVGLDIGAQTPAEIAVSILAQIIQIRARRNAERPAAPHQKASVDSAH
jgi:xanthine dehydrogenase accessory factor